MLKHRFELNGTRILRARHWERLTLPPSDACAHGGAGRASMSSARRRERESAQVQRIGV
jgi:hypothetical protein